MQNQDNNEFFEQLKFWARRLEEDRGLQILESLCEKVGRPSGNWQKVRFMDTTRTSQEFISKTRNGIYHFIAFSDVGYGEKKALFPINAYMLAHNVKWWQAVVNLVKDFYGDKIGGYQKVEKFVPKKIEKKAPQKIDYVPDEIVKRSLEGGYENSFYTFFCELFGQEMTDHVFQRYFVGAGKNDITVFWTRDAKGFRTGKCVNYGLNGKRSKERLPFAVTKNLEGHYSACLFGEHLIEEESVCFIVESEKTALLCTAAVLAGKMPSIAEIPDPVFLATGGTALGDESRYKVLKNKAIVLVPDCDWAGRTAYGLFPKVSHFKKEYMQAEYLAYYQPVAKETSFIGYTEHFEHSLSIAKELQDSYADVHFEFGGLGNMLAEMTNPERLFFWDIAPERSDKYDIGDWVVEEMKLNQLK